MSSGSTTMTSTAAPALHNSLSSISSSQTLPADISRTYKQASQLFLTRRISEALDTLSFIIEIPSSDPENGNDTDSPEQHTEEHLAPIATASRGARVKVWSLYISILNAVVEMGQEAGKQAFGISRWKALVAKTKNGNVWDEVRKIGYRDREGDIDADVVGNLATLLLAHAPSQKVTQQRLETYLSACSNPSLDVTSHMARPKTNGNSHTNGTSTPRDLGSRLKILEIYTLHVLPRNEEWEYAKEFITMSEVLDDERKEAFLHALQNIQDEKDLDSKREEQLQKQRDEQLEESRRKQEEARLAQQKHSEQGTKRMKEKEASRMTEHDFGVDRSRIGGKSTSKPAQNGAASSSKSASHAMKASKPSTQPTASNKKAKSSPPPGFYRRVMLLGDTMQQTILSMGQNMKAHPMALMRMLAFLIALIMALARRDVRDRLTRVREASWDKLKRTVGMGVKVSYI